PAAAESATLIFLIDDPNGSPSVALSGTGLLATADLGATSIAFGNQRKGSTSASKSVRVTNNGNTMLNISGLAATGDFAVTTATPVNVGPSTFADIDVTFSPSATGERTGTLTITSGAGSPTVALSGS